MLNIGCKFSAEWTVTDEDWRICRDRREERERGDWTGEWAGSESVGGRGSESGSSGWGGRWGVVFVGVGSSRIGGSERERFPRSFSRKNERSSVAGESVARSSSSSGGWRRYARRIVC